jgi:hypothetical protein
LRTTLQAEAVARLIRFSQFTNDRWTELTSDRAAKHAPLYDYAAPAYGYGAVAPATAGTTIVIVTPAPAYTAPPVGYGYYNYAPGYWGGYGRWGAGYWGR